MAIKNLLIKTKPYDGVRTVIQAQQLGTTTYYYTEAKGDRHYYTITGSTASPTLETVDFSAYLSFTMSGFTSYSFDIVPMNPGETCMLDVRCSAINDDATKAYIGQSFGGYRHSGSSLVKVGGSVDITSKSDFGSTVGITFSTSGTQSVKLTITGETSEDIDWDIYLKFTKGFHSLSTGGGSDNPSWYPAPPINESVSVPEEPLPD